MPLRTFLTNKTTKNKWRLNGVVPSKRLPQKPKLQKKFGSHRVFSERQLPPKVDLRFSMTPIEDQSSVASW
jgi:hypothetical protein